MIAGFVIAGAAARKVLIRGIGPELARFQVNEPLPNPTLALHDASSSAIAFNDDWNLAPNLTELRDATALTGAFSLTEDSRDAAMLVELPPGLYTAVMRSGDGGSGVGLVEIYDVQAGDSPQSQLINLSTRGTIGLGYDALIPGLVVMGSEPERLLLRAVGPGLARLEIDNFFPDPALRVYVGNDVIASNDDWGDTAEVEAIIDAAKATGAFRLATDEKEAVLLVTLPPGLYTVVVEPSWKAGFPTGQESGICLVEVYRVP